MMRKVFINLDRSTDRLETFLRRNKHIEGLERFSAIDGRGINRQLLKREGLLQEGLCVDYSDGALGCALSHKAQWESIISEGEGRTIIEDDTVFCKNFEEEHQRLLSTLPETWDIVLWCYPLGEELLIDLSPPDLPYFVASNSLNYKSLMRNVATWPERCISGNLYKLYGVCGLGCYSLSPRGAEKFLKFCFPIRPLPLKRKNILQKRENYNYFVINDGIDRAMEFLYPKIEAYVCVPHLVAVRLDEKSTIGWSKTTIQRLKAWLFRKTMEVDLEFDWQKD